MRKLRKIDYPRRRRIFRLGIESVPPRRSEKGQVSRRRSPVLLDTILNFFHFNASM